jgi:hypothetical protein
LTEDRREAVLTGGAADFAAERARLGPNNSSRWIDRDFLQARQIDDDAI